jgi:hypothetical protein
VGHRGKSWGSEAAELGRTAFRAHRNRLFEGTVFGPGDLIDAHLEVLEQVLEGEVLQAGLTAGAAGNDHGLVGGDAAAHQQRADLIKGLEFVGILFGLIGVVRLRECLPGDVLGRPVAADVQDRGSAVAAHRTGRSSL